MNRNRNLLLLIVLIVVIGGLALFAWQNWSPSLSLTFLGLKSIPLPLSVWILGAIVAGMITYLLIYATFGLSNYLLRRSLQPSRPRSRKSQYQDKSEESRDRYSQSQETSDYQSSFNLNKDSELREEDENSDDWEKGPPKVSNSWDGSTKEQDLEEPQESVNQSSTEKNYEAEQQPKTESWSGSVYSYGYREPSGSGVGQTESVYDADYRVITPPPPPDPSKSTENEENQEEVPDQANKQENQSE
ncbi:MAG: LapA family protein [Cyanobacteria bacterium P01_H01_bin.35]